MKKIIASILMIGLCTFISAQSVLNVSGVVTNTDGTSAEGVFLSLAILDIDEQFVTETNAEGFYEFNVDLDENNTQGCFQIFLINCTFEAIIEEGCYNPGNYNFNYDFIYCEDGTDVCLSFIFPEIQDSAFLVLVVESFGVGPFTYEWSDGSTGETLTLPLDAEGEYCVIVTDSEGCEFEACIDLTPPDPCFVHIFEEYDYNSLVLYAEGYGQTDDLEYLWNTGETGQSITITESGEYCVTLTDGLDCESIDCRYFEVDSTWFEQCFSYIYSSFEDTDSVETLFVESFGEAPFTYIWSFGDNVVSTSSSYSPTEAGVYCVEVTDAEGCVSTACYDYFIWEECGVWIACDPTDSGAVLLWAFGYGAEPIEYDWNTGEVGPEIIVTESGEYCVTITDAEGCSSSSCLNVEVEEVAECFTPIEIIEFPDYSILTINPITDGPYEFIWNNEEQTASITVEETGTYCVEVIELETGCTFSTCATVYIGGQEECWGWIETEYSGDSSAVLSVFAIDMSNDSMGFQYLWSTGEDTETIEVFEEGEYCVTVTGAANCVFEACTNVTYWDFPWQNSIFGVVYESGTGNNVSATVDIYSVLDNWTLELYSEGNETFEGGFFVVEDVEPGSYIALAVANDGGYVPTYGYSTTSWENADIYVIDDNTSVIPLEISMIPITDLNGGGTIEGLVTTDNLVAKGKKSDSRNGVPLEDANVMLMHSDIPVGQVFTNDEGFYKFTGLPYGTYEVVLEIPGHERKIIEVTLTEENPNATGVEFETDVSTSSTDNISALSSLTLSPNPTSNTLVVDAYFDEAKTVMYKVVDMNGKIIESSTIEAVLGENTILLDVTRMDNGVYNLVLQSNEELMAKRFIKL